MAATTAELTWEQYNETGRRLFAEGNLAAADEAFTAAIAEAERTAADPLQLASSISNLAQLKYQQKDSLKAEELFRRALEIRERALGPDDKSVISSINNLAALYVSRGALDDAEPLLERAMGASVKRVESSQADLAINLNNLARLHFKRGDYAQAEPLLLQLLTLKRPLGPEHPEVSTVLVSLAKVRQAVGKPDMAERLWRRVLMVRERTLPPGDPATMQACDGLADAYAAQGKLSPALQLRERALAAREEAMGKDHPAVAAQRVKVDELRSALAASTASTTVPVRPRRPAVESNTLGPMLDSAPIELADPDLRVTPTPAAPAARIPAKSPATPIPPSRSAAPTAPSRTATPLPPSRTATPNPPSRTATPNPPSRSPVAAPAAAAPAATAPRRPSVPTPRAPTPGHVATVAPKAPAPPPPAVTDEVEDEPSRTPTLTGDHDAQPVEWIDPTEKSHDRASGKRERRKLRLAEQFTGEFGGASRNRGLIIAIGVAAVVGCVAVGGIIFGPSLFRASSAAGPAKPTAVAATPADSTTQSASPPPVAATPAAVAPTAAARPPEPEVAEPAADTVTHVAAAPPPPAPKVAAVPKPRPRRPAVADLTPETAPSIDAASIPSVNVDVKPRADTASP